MNINDKIELAAGGPGSGRHPGFGEKGGLLEKYGDFMQRHNPDMTDATQHYAHAAKFFNSLGEGGKKVMHGFLDHMKNAAIAFDRKAGEGNGDLGPQGGIGKYRG